jgi:hypothetical protein
VKGHQASAANFNAIHRNFTTLCDTACLGAVLPLDVPSLADLCARGDHIRKAYSKCTSTPSPTLSPTPRPRLTDYGREHGLGPRDARAVADHGLYRQIPAQLARGISRGKAKGQRQRQGPSSSNRTRGRG